MSCEMSNCLVEEGLTKTQEECVHTHVIHTEEAMSDQIRPEHHRLSEHTHTHTSLLKTREECHIHQGWLEARVIKSWATLNFGGNYAFKGVDQPQIIFLITC